MSRRRPRPAAALVAALLAVMSGGAASHADVMLPALIGDNMVGTPASKLPPLPSTVGLDKNTPTVLFNGMISPLVPFGM
ncbi:MAG: hypothetical protein ACYTFF_06395, partial [Planctomycetota bacterium]